MSCIESVRWSADAHPFRKFTAKALLDMSTVIRRYKGNAENSALKRETNSIFGIFQTIFPHFQIKCGEHSLWFMEPLTELKSLIPRVCPVELAENQRTNVDNLVDQLATSALADLPQAVVERRSVPIGQGKYIRSNISAQ